MVNSVELLKNSTSINLGSISDISHICPHHLSCSVWAKKVVMFSFVQKIRFLNETWQGWKFSFNYKTLETFDTEKLSSFAMSSLGQKNHVEFWPKKFLNEAWQGWTFLRNISHPAAFTYVLIISHVQFWPKNKVLPQLQNFGNISHPAPPCSMFILHHHQWWSIIVPKDSVFSKIMVILHIFSFDTIT